MKWFSLWFQRKFVGTELGTLLLILLLLLFVFWTLGTLLMPVLVSIVIAYLLDRLVLTLNRCYFPNVVSVHLVYCLFLGALVFSLLILLPLLWDQLSAFFNEIPTRIKKLEAFLIMISKRYPAYISKAQTLHLINTFQSSFSHLGRNILSFSFATLSKLITLVIYLILVPLMVYFLMKDKRVILAWFGKFLPQKKALLTEVWHDIDQQMGCYISAKILEFIIVASIATGSFLFFKLNYAILLGVIVGLSVLVPYVGVVIVTIPVVIVSYMQWGGQDVHFFYVMVIYLILMLIDGNILAPLLFSGTMQINPVGVITAILIFGGLWGFWGVFFAIPIASVIKVLLQVWLKTA